MSKFTAIALSILISSAPLIVQAQSSLSETKAKNDRALGFSIAPIKSAEELANYIKSTPTGKSPLRYFSNVDRRIFLDSLTFGEKGLSGFSYGALKSSLNQKKATEVLSLFGAQYLAQSIFDPAKNSLMAPTDYKEYKCKSTATCSLSPTDICIGDNC
jgi:hypothetical protein